jgi:hypothetical protein
MPEPLTWTFDVFEPEPEPENPAPEQTAVPLERVTSPKALGRLVVALFGAFRDEPEIYHRLRDIVAAWRDSCAPIGPLANSPG